MAQLQDTGIFVVTSDTAMPPAILQNARIDAIRITGVTPGSPLAEAAATAFAVRTGDPLEWLKLQRGLPSELAVRVAKADFTVEMEAEALHEAHLAEIEI